MNNKKNKFYKAAATALALSAMLNMSACGKTNNKNESKESNQINDSIIVDTENSLKQMGVSSYCDENNIVHVVVEISPIVIRDLKSYPASKYTENGIEEATCYSEVTSYIAPSIATRGEGSGPNMRGFVEYEYPLIY